MNGATCGGDDDVFFVFVGVFDFVVGLRVGHRRVVFAAVRGLRMLVFFPECLDLFEGRELSTIERSGEGLKTEDAVGERSHLASSSRETNVMEGKEYEIGVPLQIGNLKGVCRRFTRVAELWKQD